VPSLRAVTADNAFTTQEKWSTTMPMGSLEYVVIGLDDAPFTSTVLPVLQTIQKQGAVRVIDLVFVHKGPHGDVTAKEVSELSAEHAQRYNGIAQDLLGVLTAEDIERVAGELPPDTSAAVVLLEHTWTTAVTEAVRTAGGVLFAGGLIPHETVAHVSDELAASVAAGTEDEHA
jgi:hypothetical protein